MFARESEKDGQKGAYTHDERVVEVGDDGK